MKRCVCVNVPILIFSIIYGLFRYLDKRNVLYFILLLSSIHLIKLFYTWNFYRKNNVMATTESAAPTAYVKFFEFLCGKGWEDSCCHPMHFDPIMRLLTFVIISGYLILYEGGVGIKGALISSFLYWFTSVYPSYVPHKLLLSNKYNGNFIFSITTTLLIIFEIVSLKQ